MATSAPLAPQVSKVSAVLDYDATHGDLVVFTTDWPGPSVITTVLPHALYDSLGSPDQITVTLTPGDALTYDVEAGS